MTPTTRKPAVALGWFPHNAATESAVIDMASSRQIALRTRLRNHYWLTEGRPIGAATVGIIRKKMTMIDLRDVLSEEEVSEVLSDHYGFTATADGWTIPDLDEARGVAIGSLEAIRARASAGGKAKAAKAAAAEATGQIEGHNF
jgi:hypothetical protein